MVLRNDLERWSSLDNRRRSVFACEIQLPIRQDRRRTVSSRRGALSPVHRLPSQRLVAVHGSVITQDIKIRSVGDWSWHVRTEVRRPDAMRLRDISTPACTNRYQRTFTTRNKDQVT